MKRKPFVILVVAVGVWSAAGIAAARMTQHFTEEQYAPMRAALLSEDPEAALISLLSDAVLCREAIWALGAVGGARGATALELILAQTGQEAQGVAPYAAVNLFLIRTRLLPLQEQVGKISEYVDNLIASQEQPARKRVQARGLVRRLGMVALPSAVAPIHRIIAVNLNLRLLERWWDPEYLAEAIDRIDDPAGTSLLETIYAELPELDRPAPHPADLASQAWWRFKLRVTDPALWPQLLHDVIAARSPEVGFDEAAAAAGMIGPAAVPPLRQIAEDREAAPISRTRAFQCLGVLGGPEALSLMVRVATDPSELEEVRVEGAYWPSACGTPEALSILSALARRFASERSDRLLNSTLTAMAEMRHLRASPEDEQLLVSLLQHPSELIRARAYYALGAVGSGKSAPILLNELENGTFGARTGLARVLNRAEEPQEEILAALREQLKDSEPQKREDAAWVLAEIADLASLPALIEAGKADGDPGMAEVWESFIKRLHEVSEKKALEELKPAAEEAPL